MPTRMETILATARQPGSILAIAAPPPSARSPRARVGPPFCARFASPKRRRLLARLPTRNYRLVRLLGKREFHLSLFEYNRRHEGKRPACVRNLPRDSPASGNISQAGGNTRRIRPTKYSWPKAGTWPPDRGKPAPRPNGRPSRLADCGFLGLTLLGVPATGQGWVWISCRVFTRH